MNPLSYVAKIRKFLPHLVAVFIGILGLWLIYWNLVEFITIGLNTGVWNPDLVVKGLPSIVVGIIIVTLDFLIGVRVLL